MQTLNKNYLVKKFNMTHTNTHIYKKIRHIKQGSKFNTKFHIDPGSLNAEKTVFYSLRL